MDTQSKTRNESGPSLVALCGWGGLSLLGLSAILFLFTSQIKALGIDPSIVLAPGLIGMIMLVVAAVVAYDSQPLPTIPVKAPVPLLLTDDEPWRNKRVMKLRFLGRLVDEVNGIESEIKRRHASAVSLYTALPESSGMIEYRSQHRSFNNDEERKGLLIDQLPSHKERIDKIFGGDVGSEILELEEAIQKLKRSREELDRQVIEGQASIERCKADPCRDCESWPDLKTALRAGLHSIDFKIIELETDLKELREFDFHLLWSDLGLPGPPNLTRVAKDRLEDIRGKVELINSIPQLAPRKPKPDLVEQRNLAEERHKERADCEQRMAQLRLQRQSMGQTIQDEPQRRQMENILDDALQREMEKWSRLV